MLPNLSADPLSRLASSVLARILSLAGQVAFRQTVYLEVDVLNEMKRRQAVMEEGKETGKKRKSKAKVNLINIIFVLYISQRGK